MGYTHYWEPTEDMTQEQFKWILGLKQAMGWTHDMDLKPTLNDNQFSSVEKESEASVATCPHCVEGRAAHPPRWESKPCPQCCGTGREGEALRVQENKRRDDEILLTKAKTAQIHHMNAYHRKQKRAPNPKPVSVTHWVLSQEANVARRPHE